MNQLRRLKTDLTHFGDFHHATAAKWGFKHWCCSTQEAGEASVERRYAANTMKSCGFFYNSPVTPKPQRLNLSCSHVWFCTKGQRQCAFLNIFFSNLDRIGFWGRFPVVVGQRKHVLLEGSSSLLAVSKPESKKAENKAALWSSLWEAGCSLSVCVSIFNPLIPPPPPSPSLAKIRR